MRGLTSEKTANADGTYTHKYVVEWTAELPGDWRVLAYTKSILAIRISANQIGWSGVRPGDYAFTTVSHPNGRYTIVVQTSADDQIELKHELVR